MKPYFERDGITLFHGDCIQVLASLESMSVSALITDPPYSSGGFTRGDRTADPSSKYVQTGTELVRESFSGDNRDGRSWCYWCAVWMSECSRLVKPSGYAMVFCDWRQLPLMTDAIQAGGFVWRGIVSWNKGPSARAPHTGYFRHQCEYIAWGTNGVSKPSDGLGGPYDGCINEPVKLDDKHHMTGKPTSLMERLCQPVSIGSTILDPFAGSSTTLLAAWRLGRKAVGVELSEAYCEISANRLNREMDQGRLFKPEAETFTQPSLMSDNHSPGQVGPGSK